MSAQSLKISSSQHSEKSKYVYSKTKRSKKPESELQTLVNCGRLTVKVCCVRTRESTDLTALGGGRHFEFLFDDNASP